MSLSKKITTFIFLITFCNVNLVANSNDLFNKGQNIWKQISSGQCEQSQKDISFPFWIDGEFTDKENWGELCAGLNGFSKKAKTEYKEELGKLYLHKIVTISKENPGAKRDKYPRFAEFVKNNKTNLNVVLVMWQPNEKPEKKSGISLIFSCKTQSSCTLSGIDDKLLLSL